jgi:hypothetical protein
LVEDQRTSIASTAVGPALALRWLLTVPLALGVAGHLWVLAWSMAEPAQAALYYLGNAAIDLVPAGLYAVAAVLLVTGRGSRAAWVLLLLCGLVLTAVALYYVLIGGWGELFILPPYLVALAVVELVLLSRARVAASP